MMKLGFLAALLAGAFIFSGCLPEKEKQTVSDYWKVDFDGALQLAAEEDKYILVNISGMSWCGWCHALDEEVFSKTAFAKYAEENLIPVQLDYMSDGRPTAQEFAEQHQALLMELQVRSFPTVLILNPQGQIVDQTGYQTGGPKKYIEYINNVIGFNELM